MPPVRSEPFTYVKYVCIGGGAAVTCITIRTHPHTTNKTIMCERERQDYRVDDCIN